MVEVFANKLVVDVNSKIKRLPVIQMRSLCLVRYLMSRNHWCVQQTPLPRGYSSKLHPVEDLSKQDHIAATNNSSPGTRSYEKEGLLES